MTGVQTCALPIWRFSATTMDTDTRKDTARAIAERISMAARGIEAAEDEGRNYPMHADRGYRVRFLYSEGDSHRLSMPFREKNERTDPG